MLSIGGGCVPEEPPGTTCEEKEECLGGLCFQEQRYGEPTGWWGGYCTGPCDASCGSGGSCVQLDHGTFCLAVCVDDSDCREGYRCDPWVETCLPDCRLGWDCGDVHDCNDDGYCEGLEIAGEDTDTSKYGKE